METIKATVKKYSREYTRTLKDGKKKKYHTEQVQITIPKEDDVFEDNETVCIIKSSDISKIKNDSSETDELKAINMELEQDNNRLKSTIEEKNSTNYEFETKISNLEEKIDLLQKKLNEKNIETLKKEEEKNTEKETLQKQIETLQKQKNTEKETLQKQIETLQKQKNTEKETLEEKLSHNKKELKEDKKDLEEKIGILKSYIDDLKNITATLKSSQNKEILKLEDEYSKLDIKYQNKKEALAEAEKIANKLKEFILKSY